MCSRRTVQGFVPVGLVELELFHFGVFRHHLDLYMFTVSVSPFGLNPLASRGNLEIAVFRRRGKTVFQTPCEKPGANEKGEPRGFVIVAPSISSPTNNFLKFMRLEADRERSRPYREG